MLSLVPVKNQDGEYLAMCQAKALAMAFDLGLDVVACVSDNNTTNTRAVGILAGGGGPAKERHQIGNTFTFNHRGTDHQIAFVIDYPHNLKNFRNQHMSQVSVIMF